MDSSSPALAPADTSRAPGWTLSITGVAVLAATIAVVLLLFYLTGRFIWMYEKKAAASAAAEPPRSPAPSLPIRRVVSLSLLPVFVHAEEPAGAAERARECTVCLAEFRERETGRLLPGCGHGFHEKCVVTWLQLNLTCPVCRADVATE